MSDNLRDMVEDRHAHPDIETARNMPDAASAGSSVIGYAAVNGLSSDEDIARLAYRLYQERQERGEEGTADGDWFRAEEEVSRRRDMLND